MWVKEKKKRTNLVGQCIKMENALSRELRHLGILNIFQGGWPMDI